MVLPNTALHLKALLDFEDKNGDKVMAGDEWLFEGPGELSPSLGVCLGQGFLPFSHNLDIFDCEHRPPSPSPGTYIPQKEVEVVEIIQATVVKQNQALRLRARKECFDRDGKERVTGGINWGTVVGGQAGWGVLPSGEVRGTM